MNVIVTSAQIMDIAKTCKFNESAMGRARRALSIVGQMNLSGDVIKLCVKCEIQFLGGTPGNLKCRKCGNK